MKYFPFLILYSFFLISCNLPLNSINNSNHQTYNTSVAKIQDCTVRTSLQNPQASIGVVASYMAKVFDVELLNSSSSISQAIQSKSIRYANYNVTNSSGEIVLCGNTGLSGQFNIQLKTNSQYQINIFSYSLNTNIANVAVMNSPNENLPYFISQSFNTGNTNSVNLLATLELGNKSGAFNILDQLIESNLFLQNNTQNCQLCSAEFTNSPFLEVYWKPGLNPNSYLNNPNNPVSFFLNFTKKNTQYYRIFILGGVNGISDDNVDTDEFDNSVIIHEYAHFLMSVFSQDSSPGGAHYGLSSIDPRLAWSEGFADFFQAAVLNKNFYLDITGNNNAIIVPFEKQSNLLAQDQPQIKGEGNYREFSIARFFWDIIDSSQNYNFENDDDSHAGTAQDFRWIWGVITSPAFKSNLFTSMGLFNEVQNFQLSSNPIPWNSIRELHMQHNPENLFFRSLYGLEASNSCQNSQDLLQFTETTIPNDVNYMLQNKRTLIYNHPATGSVFLSLRGENIKFYIQNLNSPMENTKIINSDNYTHKSESNADCTDQGYAQCLNANLKKGTYLIEYILQKNITAPLNFQFFTNNQELCGTHTSYNILESNLNHRKLASNKLTAPFNLKLSLLQPGLSNKHLYQLEATFTNQDLVLTNLEVEWKHSNNIKIISGATLHHFSSIPEKKEIKIRLLIEAKEELSQSTIYLLAKATYKDRLFPKTLAFSIKQLVDMSQSAKSLNFKSTLNKEEQNIIIRH